MTSALSPTPPVAFTKAHGTGNDFVLLPDPGDALALTGELVRALCDRRRGLGGDGVIRLAPGDRETDVFMDYRNADGSVAEMCGNGVRCVAKHVADRAPGGPGAVESVRVGTRAGVKDVAIAGREADGRTARLRVDMGAPEVVAEAHLLDLQDERVHAVLVSMGNPHAVLVVDDVGAAPLARWGPVIGAHPDFPEGTNVEVIRADGDGHVAGRIFERGVGETLSSGTGASAMAVAAHVRGLARRETTVRLPGGELDVSWGERTLWVTGAAVEVASGELDPGWWAAAGAGGATTVERTTTGAT